MRNIVLMGCVLWLTGCGVGKSEVVVREVVEDIREDVGVVIDEGEKSASYSAELVEGDTVLSVLEKVEAKEAVGLVVKEYSFGVMVEAIGGLSNSRDKAWIYYVDGKAADVGAGSRGLVDGQVVEWRYEDVQ